MENQINDHEEEIVNPEQFQVGRAATEEKDLDEVEDQEEGSFLAPEDVEYELDDAGDPNEDTYDPDDAEEL